MRCILRRLPTVALAAALGTASALADGRTGFISYPGFVKPGALVELVHDKGLMLEMVVRCPGGVGMLTYSKVERLYCTPRRGCAGNFKAAVGRLCQ